MRYVKSLLTTAVISAASLILLTRPASAQESGSPQRDAGPAQVESAAPQREAGSRAEEQAIAQQEKARELSPYKAPWLERKLLEIEAAGGFAAARGFVVTFGDIKRGSGMALGPAYGKTLASGAVVQAKAAYSINNYKLAQVSAVSPPLSQGRVRFNGRVRWQDAPSVRLYPLGPDSPEILRDYSETKTEASGHAAFRPVRLLQFDGGAGFERFITAVLPGGGPSGDFLFAGLPGAGADPDYLHAYGAAAIDSRDGAGYSRHGTLLRATLHQYGQLNDGPYSFKRADSEAQQYVPILHGNWVLFFRLHASTTYAADGKSVPFFLMPDLGGHDLRGFGNYRFRDRNSLLVTAEYRWYAQEYLDGAIFYDAGKTVPNRSALDFRGLKSSVGAGIRLHGPQTTVLRLELARSREGLRLIMAFSPVGE